jgi:REP element-mobilizing transposase RayT
VARGFARFIEASELTVYSCAILPEHVHVVIARHRYDVEQVVNLLKGAATKCLKAESLSPDGPVWARHQWKVFLNTPDDVRRAIMYVGRNPLKERKPKQHWSFVTPVDPV